MTRFRIEMREGQSIREVEADQFEQREGWIVFYRLPPQGGSGREYWRVRVEMIIGMETCRT